jgi:hypothetical protein
MYIYYIGYLHKWVIGKRIGSSRFLVEANDKRKNVMHPTDPKLQWELTSSKTVLNIPSTGVPVTVRCITLAPTQEPTNTPTLRPTAMPTTPPTFFKPVFTTPTPTTPVPVASTPAPTPPKLVNKLGDWTRYHQKGGSPFYYNGKTGVTTTDEPSVFQQYDAKFQHSQTIFFGDSSPKTTILAVGIVLVWGIIGLLYGAKCMGMSGDSQREDAEIKPFNNPGANAYGHGYDKYENEKFDIQKSFSGTAASSSSAAHSSSADSFDMDPSGLLNGLSGFGSSRGAQPSHCSTEPSVPRYEPEMGEEELTINEPIMLDDV